MADEMEVEREPDRESAKKADKMFTLKKWNLVAMWSWDVECDTCAICRVQVMGKRRLHCFCVQQSDYIRLSTKLVSFTYNRLINYRHCL